MTKRKRLRAMTNREFCNRHKCSSCPEYDEKQKRCCISTGLRIAENAEYITCWGTYILVEVSNED